jgi:hypothetical protein
MFMGWPISAAFVSAAAMMLPGVGKGQGHDGSPSANGYRQCVLGSVAGRVMVVDVALGVDHVFGGGAASKAA